MSTKPAVGEEDEINIFIFKEIRDIVNTIDNDVSLKGIATVFFLKAIKTSKPNREALFTDAHRKHKYSKSVRDIHVIKYNMNTHISMFGNKFINDIIDGFIEKDIAIKIMVIEKSIDSFSIRRELIKGEFIFKRFNNI